MAQTWEEWLRAAARPASAAEEERRDGTEARVREAVRRSTELPNTVSVYVKGSYANNTNVRRDADVDIAVEWTETSYVNTWGETAGLGPRELGYTPVPIDISPTDFRARVERALIASFGSTAVDTSGDKAIDIEATSTTLEADVVPSFSMTRYDPPGVSHRGHRIFPKSGGYIDNYPRQNYENGVTKNQATGGRYKDIVRCTKRLEDLLLDRGEIPREYPGYLIECLIYNAPENKFGKPTLYEDLQNVFAFLWNGFQRQWNLGSRLTSC